MRRHIHLFLVSTLLISGSGIAIQAAPETDSLLEYEETGPRKRPSIFRRAAKDTPAEQLQYAQGLRDAGKIRAAGRQFRALVHTWHQAPEAVKAQVGYANLLEQGRRYQRAFDEYQYLIDNYTGDFSYEEILEHQFRIANHVRGALHGKFLFYRGFETPERSLAMFEKIVENAPNWKRAPEAQFHVGLIHEHTKEYEMAISAYEALQLRYPRSSFVAAAAFQRAHCLTVVADRSPRDETRSKVAISALALFLRDFPADPNGDAAQERLDRLKKRLADMYFERALSYDKTAGRPQAAVIAYTDFIKKFPTSDRRNAVQSRLESLQKELEEENEKN